MKGTPLISVEDWKLNTEYKGQFNESHKVIKWFWEILNTLTQE
jgi:E3 ubiquitin-protein ligase HECW2